MGQSLWHVHLCVTDTPPFARSDKEYYISVCITFAGIAPRQHYLRLHTGSAPQTSATGIEVRGTALLFLLEVVHSIRSMRTSGRHNFDLSSCILEERSSLPFKTAVLISWCLFWKSDRPPRKYLQPVEEPRLRPPTLHIYGSLLHTMAPQTRSSAPGHNVPATAPSAHTKPTATAIGRRGQSRKKPVRPPSPTVTHPR